MHQNFNTWIGLVDEAIREFTADHLGRDDLIDFDYALAFEDGMSADEAATRALNNDPTGRAFMIFANGEWVD